MEEPKTLPSNEFGEGGEDRGREEARKDGDGDLAYGLWAAGRLWAAFPKHRLSLVQNSNGT